MARVGFEELFDSEVARVFIAGFLREARKTENALTEKGIDYTVDIEPYCKIILGIFPSVYAGAAFYVQSAQADLARSTLIAAGLKSGIQDGEDS